MCGQFRQRSSESALSDLSIKLHAEVQKAGFGLSEAEVSDGLDALVVLAITVGTGGATLTDAVNRRRFKKLVDKLRAIIKHFLVAVETSFVEADTASEDTAYIPLFDNLPVTRTLSEKLGWASTAIRPPHVQKKPLELVWTLVSLAVGLLPAVLEADVFADIAGIIGTVLGTTGGLSPDDEKAVRQLLDIVNKIAN